MSDSKVEGDIFLSEACALEEGLRLGGAGVWRWEINSDNLQWTRNLETVHQLPPGYFDGTLSSFRKDLHPSDAEHVWKKIHESITQGVPYRAVYRGAPRANHDELWIETCGGLATAPDGTRYMTGICFDVSDRVRKEQQLKRRLDQQKAVALFGTFALNESDLLKVLNEAVRVAAGILNVPLAKILQFSNAADQLVLRAGIGWKDGSVGSYTVGIDETSQAGFALSQNRPVIVSDLLDEKRFSGASFLREHGVRSGISVIVPGVGGRPYGVFGAHARDVREFDNADAEFLQSLANIVASAARQAAAADHQTLLVREMAHRAGNMLQLVNTMANQTFHPDAQLSMARKSFVDRLSALANSNYLIARGGWTYTSFTELVKESLKAFDNRVTIRGKELLLPPEFCFDMGLVLHELATNSAKYGILGTNTGSIETKWHSRRNIDGSTLFCFEWNDPVSTFETCQKGSGFGSKLISALIEQKWKGAVNTDRDSGFRVNMEIPLALDTQ